MSDDNNSRHKLFQLFKYANEHSHKCVRWNEFKALNKGLRNNTMKRKFSETLFNKEFKLFN